MSRTLDGVIAQALAGDGDRTALEYRGRAIPWRYLRDVADKVDALLSEAGLGRSAAIAFVPRNRPAFVGALLSLIAARRSVIMVYAFQSPAAIAADIARIACPAVIADVQDWTAETLAALPDGALAIGLASDIEADPQVRLVAGGLAADRSGLRAPTAEPVVEMLTSGTTGTPKRAPTLYSVMERALITGSVLDAGRDGGGGAPGTVNFPISNISGLYSLLPMLAARRLVLFQEKFDLDDWLAFVAKYRPDIVILPPAGVRMMLDRAIPQEAMDGVRFVQIGTAPIDPDAQRAFEARYGVTILLSYGATEFCGAATTMTADDHARFGDAKFGSVGRAFSGNEVRIVDQADDARLLRAGETGIIEVKVPVLGDGFIRTNDLGMLDEDGFLYHRGRVDGVIVRGGFKILPATVEHVLNNLPGIAAACVVGVSEPRLGHVPVAVIELMPGAARPDDAALGAALRRTLPATNIPVAYHVVEAMPRTPSLKIDLKAVRALAEDRYGQRAKEPAA